MTFGLIMTFNLIYAAFLVVQVNKAEVAIVVIFRIWCVAI